MSEQAKQASDATASSVGLVLSGGGAKGAYQVGVLKALNELGVQVDMLAGASIGALNGALIAAADNQLQAAQNLETLWLELADSSPITLGSMRVKLPAYLSMLGAFGLKNSMIVPAIIALRRGMEIMPKGPSNLIKQLEPLAGLLQSEDGWLCDKRIKQLIDRYLRPGGLPERLPLHISVYPTQGGENDLLRIIGASFGLGDTAPSDFLLAQSLAPAEQKKLLLASAALPLLYASQEVNGKLYTDGGQGGWRETQGNTPIAPLLDAGCKHIIVTHLSDGSMWDRTRFPSASIIEIRPKTAHISRNGAVRDLIGFDNEKIPSWIRQGYEDTHACIGPIKKTLGAFGGMARAELQMDATLRDTGQAELREAMRRLDGD
ncbi:MAG: patatin-like phospholipase family protein [Trinickia sp.]|uniref:patatin-like phospholipase family protein n=1 Tax=Trinickia sp. TaxID=2571163 RepID=UPI003F821DFB